MAVTISVSGKFESTRFMLYWYEIEVITTLRSQLGGWAECRAGELNET